MCVDQEADYKIGSTTRLDYLLHENLPNVSKAADHEKSLLSERAQLDDSVQYGAQNSFLCLKWWNFLDAEAAVDREWKDLETIPAW